MLRDLPVLEQALITLRPTFYHVLTLTALKYHERLRYGRFRVHTDG